MPAFQTPSAASWRLIQGSADARFYHGHYIDDSGREVRSVSNRLLMSSLPLDAGAEHGAAAVHDMFNDQWAVRTIEPGQVDVISTRHHVGTGLEGDEGQRHPVLGRLGLLSHLDEASLSGVDVDILYCLGASFHNDLHGWSDSLFVNWMVSGPEVDLVMPHMGPAGRMRIRPGDCFAFDPSQPHGLTMPGEDRFIRASWTAGAAPCVFFNWIISLTPALEAIMGIERGDRSDFAKRLGWMNLQRRGINVDPETGRIRGPFKAVKSINSSSMGKDVPVSAFPVMAVAA